jgi:hypothetical protein
MKAANKLLLLGLAVVFAVVLAARAEEKEKEKPKEVTLKGELCCCKCTLKVATSCANALLVKEKDKTVTYILDDKKKGEKYHKEICPPGTKKKATVVGVVSKKDKKMYIKPSKVTFDTE